MKSILILSILLIGLHTFAQIKISGTVTNKKGELIPGVNIYIENTYNGTSTDSIGNFSFEMEDTINNILAASFIGYRIWKEEIDFSKNSNINIVIIESVNALDAVTITAGTFAAADEKRAAVLEPIDIYTTASANGDVMAAMRTMPGTQASPDDGRLMVRGGDAYETKTYIDGALIAKPYYSKTPDISTRGRFSPSLFTGVQFNSGGYSAEYGQALSSVLVLNSTDVAAQDHKGLSLMTIGGEASLTKANKKRSIMFSGDYTNLAIYQKLFKSNLNWEKPIESVNLTSAYRYKTSSSGLFKAFITGDYGRLAYNTTESTNQAFALENEGGTLYSNFSFRDCINDKTCYKIVVSSTVDNKLLKLNENTIDTKETSLESRFKVTHLISEGVNIHWGASDTYSKYVQDIKYAEFGSVFNAILKDHTIGIFTEGEIKFSKYFAIKPGIRSEYSSLINKYSFAPRFATALKTGKKSQISAAWGIYYQNPEFDYSKYNSKLELENATHYIFSYQSGNVTNRLFRAETYSKTYNNLITWEGSNPYQPEKISNEGYGYAHGIDIFWRDKKSIKYFEYWLSYSFIDTKRKYQNFPQLVKPDFISDHTFSAVTKYWFNSISTQVGAAFTGASPRYYMLPSSNIFREVKTDWYSNLSLNMSHIFYLGDQYSVFYISVSNILGNDNILGYRPSITADSAGNYSLTPIKNNLKRFVFIGLLLSF